MQIRIIRAEVKNRHSGRFITQYEALAYVEKIIYKYLKRGWEGGNRETWEYIQINNMRKMWLWIFLYTKRHWNGNWNGNDKLRYVEKNNGYIIYKYLKGKWEDVKNNIRYIKDIHKYTIQENMPYTNISWSDILSDICYKTGIVTYPIYYIINLTKRLYRVTKNKKWKELIEDYKSTKKKDINT